MLRVKKRLMVPVVLLLIIIFGGAYLYQVIEDWRYLDSVYFTVVTITTIGYGDFAPQTDGGKILTIIFPFVGIGMAFYFFSLMGKYLFSKHLRERLFEAGRINGARGVRKVRKK